MYLWKSFCASEVKLEKKIFFFWLLGVILGVIWFTSVHFMTFLSVYNVTNLCGPIVDYYEIKMFIAGFLEKLIAFQKCSEGLQNFVLLYSIK